MATIATGVFRGAGRTIVGIAGAGGDEGSDEDSSELEADAEPVSVDVYNFPIDAVRVVSVGGRSASTGGKDARGDRRGSIDNEGRTDRAEVAFVHDSSEADDEMEAVITSVSYAGCILLGGDIENDDERRDTRVFLPTTLPTTLGFIGDFLDDLVVGARGGD